MRFSHLVAAVAIAAVAGGTAFAADTTPSPAPAMHDSMKTSHHMMSGHTTGHMAPSHHMMSGHMSAHTSGHMAGHMASHTSGHMSDHMSGHMSDHMKASPKPTAQP